MHFKCPDTPFNPPDDSKPVFSIGDITVPQVLKIISFIKSSKAKDAFGLESNHIKLHREALGSPIAHLINLSLKKGRVPTTWKTAKVTPVFKAGDKINSL